VAELALDVTLLNAGPQDGQRCVEEPEFHGCADLARTLAEGVALRASPGAPLDDHDRAELEQALREPPLELLDPFARAPIEQVDLEVGHPLVGGEANRPELVLELPGERGLARGGKAADDDEPAGNGGRVSHAGEHGTADPRKRS